MLQSHRFGLHLGFVIVGLLALGACGSTPEGSETDSRVNALGTERRISPLGIDQPDPERLFQRALDASERGNTDAFLACFAFQAPNGAYFIPQGGDRSFGADANQIRAMAAGMRPFMGSSWSRVRYGRPKNVRNEPPTVEVPMEIVYDFDAASPAERQQAIADVQRLNSARGIPRAPLTWEQYTAQLARLPRTSARRFVYVGGDWRFDAAWKTSPNGWQPQR
jgi:hypothetical protein